MLDVDGSGAGAEGRRHIRMARRKVAQEHASEEVALACCARSEGDEADEASGASLRDGPEVDEARCCVVDDTIGYVQNGVSRRGERKKKKRIQLKKKKRRRKKGKKRRKSERQKLRRTLSKRTKMQARE
jgi:hypothetical protein